MADDSVDSLIRQLEILRLDQESILRCLVAARAREACSGPSSSEHGIAGSHRFRIGDRVRITNEVRSPIGRQANEGDRTGTVTKIMRKRVFVRTDNGWGTNRAPSNLQVIRGESQ
jgi:hypothetical protein